MFTEQKYAINSLALTVQNFVKKNAYSVIHKQDCWTYARYFTFVPTRLSLDFRSLSNVDYEQRKVAHRLLKSMTDGKVSFMDLRKFHYNVLCRSELKESGAEVLEGRTKSVSAKHYLLHEIDKMVEQYHNAWESLHPTMTNGSYDESNKGLWNRAGATKANN